LTGRALVAVVALAACDNGSGPPPPQASQLGVLHTIRGGPSLTVFVDGGRGQQLAFGEQSRVISLSPGEHDLTVQSADATPSLIVLFNTMEGVNYSGFAIDTMVSGSVTILPIVVADSGAVPAPAHARLRLASFAAAAPPLDAYRTEPGSVTLLAAAAPLGFRAVTRYFDAAPGSWSVVISHAGTTDTLLATGALVLGDGQAQTLVVLDSTPGGVTWRLLRDRD
jgi:hypothetical protein